MKTLYVVPKEIWEKHKWNMHPSHYLNLADGSIVVSGEFRHAGTEDNFLKDGAQAIHHICPSVSISSHPKIAEKLKHLGVTELDSTYSAFQKLRKLHPLL